MKDEAQNDRSAGEGNETETAPVGEKERTEEVTDFDRVRLRNASYEAMLAAQAAMDHAQTDGQYQLARAIYNAHNALWLLLSEKEGKK